MSTAHVNRLRLRAFLEGIEVPIIAANIQCAPNSPIVATIQVPPMSEGRKLLPRTLVHVFFLDTYSSSSPVLDGGARTDDGKNRPSEEDGGGDDRDTLNRDYKLLFVGEIVGFAWTKSQNQRCLVLQCEDLSNYWDYAFQSDNTDVFGPGMKAVFSGSATNLFTDFLSSKGNVITQIVASGRCNAFPKLKGLAAGIIRLIEAIGGTYFPRPGSNAKKMVGQNLFFSIAELRLHITSMITAYENDPTSERLLQRQGYTSMFDRALGGMGGQTSIRQAINALTKIMFHETFPQPCPMFIPGSNGSVSGSKQTNLKGHPVWGFIHEEADSAWLGMGEVKTQMYEDSEASAASLVPVISKRLTGIRTRLQQTMVRMRPTSTSKPPEAARSAFSTAIQGIGVIIGKLQKWSPRAPDSVVNEINSKIDDVAKQLDRVRGLSISETASKDIEPARLVQQILRPDTWFCAPVRSNVLFPENYDTLNWQRMFLQEPTRFLLKTNDEFFGEDFLFDKLYFAPQAGSVRKDHARLQDVLQRELLDHELFTGILPVCEKMGEFNIFAAKSGQAQGNVPKVGLAQRSANFLYFKHRFNARKMQITGKFNPYVAVGFPGLVIDKYVDLETLTLLNELRATEDLGPLDSSLLGGNFLGNFTQVTHSISQQEMSGRTEILALYGREVDEGVEFLGTLPAEARVQKKTGASSTRQTDVAAVNAPRLFGFGPNLGRITKVEDVTALYTSSGNAESGKKIPMFDVGVKSERASQKVTLVPIGVRVTAQEVNSPAIEEITGDPERGISFYAFRVTEEIPQYKQEDVLLPAEEYIRPGWYGDVWSPGKVGEVYNAFFGTGAITDVQTITGPGGSSLAQTTVGMEEAAAEDAQQSSMGNQQSTQAVNLSLEAGASIQQAVEFLHITYSFIKQQGLNTDEFIKSYTWRPIATMVDMFGTADLQLSSDGTKVEQGAEGFHSRAFGPYNDLFGLAGPEIEDILGIKRGSPAAQKADTRLRKQQAVQQYISALRFSRAVLG